MNYLDIKNLLKGNALDERIIDINVCDDVDFQKQRYLKLLEQTYKLYGDGNYSLLSAPGRSEIGGNHTDHQHGKVIAAAVNMDNIAFVKANNSNMINYHTLGFTMNSIDINDLTIKTEEKFKAEALVRGIAAGFVERGYHIGGFDGLGQSNVLMGSGISSSASFEILIAQIFNHLFNEGRISPIELAKIAQTAENQYFMKPCGLLDQMAISVGGFVYIDFKNPDSPIVEKLDFNFKDYGYNLVLVNTKGNHADLSDEYASIPNEIKEVAAYFDEAVISDCSKDKIFTNIKELRNKLDNDRAILRALHVLNENDRVDQEAEALRKNDIKKMLFLMKESGNSSFKYLQNVSVNNRFKTQNLALALAISEAALECQGATRVHGGGFEGTIQAIVHDGQLEGYLKIMREVFGEDSCFILKARPEGGVKII